MRTPLKTRAKRSLATLVSALTGRHALLLPAEAAAAESILDVVAPYRIDGSTLTVQVLETSSGVLSATLLAYAGHFPTQPVWTGTAWQYDRPCTLTLDLSTGSVGVAEREWGRVPLPLPSRRFAWYLQLRNSDGHTRSRVTGHYSPWAPAAIADGYYHGENYVDHEAESSGDRGRIVQLLRQHHAHGPVLEIGCATGGLLATLERAGFAVVGLDASEWAVQQAAQRLGPGRVWACDVERETLPPDVVGQRPFGAFVLAAVLEHFAQPFTVLARLGDVAARGSVLVVTTTNADSLTHVLFGQHWEGYFDATHHGVDAVSVRRLRVELPRCGWHVVQLTTERIWDGNADPTHATLREWWDADARFRRLLSEHDLGDLITCVAVRE